MVVNFLNNKKNLDILSYEKLINEENNNENEQLHFTGVQFLRHPGTFLDICKNTHLMMLFEYTNKEFMD